MRELSANSKARASRRRLGLCALLLAGAPFGVTTCGVPDLVFDDRFFQDAGEAGDAGDGAIVVENCTNGQDDDGNLLIDCDDPACADHSCVSAAPQGWTGHVVLFVGKGPTPPSCAEPFPTLTFSGWTALVPEDAQCACACGSPSGFTCNGSFILANNSNCLPALMLQPAVLPGSCQDADVSPSSVTHAGATSTASGGSCDVTNDNALVPQAVWSKQVRACAGKLGKCAGGVCAPKSLDGFDPGVCIYRTGLQTCPVGPYANRVLMYPVDGVVDTRACSKCTCGIAVDCSKPFEVWSGANCSGSLLATLPVGAACTPLASPDASVSIKAPTPSAKCAAAGGEPTGSVVEDPSNAVTFCCIE